MCDITVILQAIDQGDPDAANELVPPVYHELRKLAAQKLAHEEPGQTLDATALVHEAYLRQVGDQQFTNRCHFFAARQYDRARPLPSGTDRWQLASSGWDGYDEAG